MALLIEILMVLLFLSIIALYVYGKLKLIEYSRNISGMDLTYEDQLIDRIATRIKQKLAQKTE